jgi:hypothetical protein
MKDDAVAPTTRALSCRRFVGYAIVFGALFLAAHLAGWRSYTGALSGTGPRDPTQAYRGAAYVILYVGATVVVPILLIAAALVRGLSAIVRRPPDAEETPASGEEQ